VAYVKSRIPQIEAKIDSEMATVVDELAKGIVEAAQRNIEPHNETGALHDSIHSEVVQPFHRHVVAGSETVDYGLYVEFGTRNRPATPFFVPAVEKVRGEANAGNSVIWKWTKTL
jgi:HK97 gp10 family phage protein